MPYRVDFGRLRRLRGSRDDALLTQVTALAAQLGADDEDEDEDEAPIAGDDEWLVHVRRIVNGEPPDATHRDDAEVVGSFMALCYLSEVGSFTLGSREMPLRDLERALETHGVADRVPIQQLFRGGLPWGASSRPVADMMEGFLSPDAVRSSAAALRSVEWKDLTPAVEETLSQLERALAEVAKRGVGIHSVAFVSKDLRWSASVMAVDLARLDAMYGSRNEAVFERVRCIVEHPEVYRSKGKLSDEAFLAWKRELDADRAGDTQPAPELPAIPRAAWEILYRKRLDAERAEVYAQALQLICSIIGAPLDNAAVAPAAPAHFDAVDEALQAEGLFPKVSFKKLIFSGPPIALPPPVDFPATGACRHDQSRRRAASSRPGIGPRTRRRCKTRCGC